MPEPTFESNTSQGSWFITGSQDAENGMHFKNGKQEGNNEKICNQLLLHRMFEKFVKLIENDGNIGKEKINQRPALIEYMEEMNVEDMKTISYKELNDQSNHLARILIRKLGM